MMTDHLPPLELLSRATNEDDIQALPGQLLGVSWGCYQNEVNQVNNPQMKR